jgi:hypothetical protein
MPWFVFEVRGQHPREILCCGAGENFDHAKGIAKFYGLDDPLIFESDNDWNAHRYAYKHVAETYKLASKRFELFQLWAFGREIPDADKDCLNGWVVSIENKVMWEARLNRTMFKHDYIETELTDPTAPLLPPQKMYVAHWWDSILKQRAKGLDPDVIPPRGMEYKPIWVMNLED